MTRDTSCQQQIGIIISLELVVSGLLTNGARLPGSLGKIEITPSQVSAQARYLYNRHHYVCPLASGKSF